MQSFSLLSVLGVRVCTQLDGVRILSSTKMEFLQRVPDATSEIFGIGSRAPGALLKDAFEKYEEGNIEADDEIREIGPDLPHAIDQCIEAACHEVNKRRTYGVKQQKGAEKMRREAQNLGKPASVSYSSSTP